MGFRHLRSVHLIVDAIGSSAFSLNDFIASAKRAGPVVLDTKRLNITYRRRSDNWGGQMQLAALKVDEHAPDCSRGIGFAVGLRIAGSMAVVDKPGFSHAWI